MTQNPALPGPGAPRMAGSRVWLNPRGLREKDGSALAPATKPWGPGLTPLGMVVMTVLSPRTRLRIRSDCRVRPHPGGQSERQATKARVWGDGPGNPSEPCRLP